MVRTIEAPTPRQVGPPHLRGHRLHCPRCESRVMFDGEEYVCVACGYEFPADELPRDVRRELGRHGRSRRMLMALGAGIAVGAMLGRGFGLIGALGAGSGLGVLAATVVAIVTTRRRPQDLR